ncbi:MAG: MBOAT family protein, partial [Vicingus serpentipes]|nr:MBOAT family protein [Vicingus serpentipes]
GFEFLENFNFPYVSKSIREFWRRWHISLSMWFRDYLYISMGGSRKSNIRTYFNLVTIFVLVGLWHGANWHYVVFGMFHGLFIVIERLGFDKILKRSNLLGHIYTLFVVVNVFVIFRLETIDEAINYFKAMFIGSENQVHYEFTMFLSVEITVIFLIAIIMSFNGFNIIYNRMIIGFEAANSISTLKWISIIKSITLLILFVYSIMAVASGSYNPFIYFRF